MQRRQRHKEEDFLIFLEIINEDNMFVSKDTTIDTILSVLNNFLNENE